MKDYSKSKISNLQALSDEEYYSKFKIEDFQALSDEEFKKYVQHEYRAYEKGRKHEEDYIPYGEYFSNMEEMMGRNKRKSWDSDF